MPVTASDKEDGGGISHSLLGYINSGNMCRWLCSSLLPDLLRKILSRKV